MSAALLTAASTIISGALDLFQGDKRQQAELVLKQLEMEQAQLTAQAEVNRTEAQHSSVFVAGWRPAIGWIGATAVAIEFVVRPLMIWASALWWPDMHVPPSLTNDNLWCLIFGMLGFGGLRSWEKGKGRAR